MLVLGGEGIYLVWCDGVVGIVGRGAMKMRESEWSE